MGIATKIPENTFEGLQLDAGVLLNSFNPASPAITDAAIICATTGGIQISCTPTYSDFGEDVDNCPNNMKELKHLDSWECVISTTCLGTSVENIRLALGAADVTALTSKIVPRRNLEQTDFGNIWWVGDRADGGLVAVKLLNALATSGFSLQTGKNAKGQITLELTGHVSISDQDTMPMEFYSLDPEDVETTYTYTVATNTTGKNPKNEGWFVLVGDDYRATTDTTVDSNVTYYVRSTT